MLKKLSLISDFAQIKLATILQEISPSLSAKIFSRLWFRVSKYRAANGIDAWKKNFNSVSINFQNKNHNVYFRKNEKHIGLIIFIHGWSGRSDQFLKMSSKFFDSEFSILCFDLPSHGENYGSKSNVFEFANFLREIHRIIPLNNSMVVCHSAGFLSWSLFSKIQNNINTIKLVLISCPGSFSYLIDFFGERFGFSQKMINELWKIIGKIGMTTSPELLLSVTHMSNISDKNVLIIHDLDDKSVLYEESSKLRKIWPNSHFVSTKGLGHNKVLSSSETIDRVFLFLKKSNCIASNQIG